ncbi:MAG: 2,3-bisphosphoglycerate-independent phosphoglycerate mutase [Thermoplasmata archaeon]|nr:2,3-bisphosphoglycerate-independent phosphoglycerate mutase [Thermoplasmata archaeon]MEA3166166.1 2,3-bisphosphoglycerate-independent phosphoglycerate mutase [Thermoplasmata archaeon]
MAQSGPSPSNAGSAKKRPGLLVVIDGFGFGDPKNICNAFELAKTPTFDRLRRECPVVDVECGGERVGLPKGQMGNSEVGHLNIGAGRVVHQDFMRINKAVADGTFGQESAIQEAFGHVKRTRGRLHLMGLLGPGGVHAHEAHFGAALKAAAKAGLKEVWVHPVGDGRDTPPKSALGYLETLESQMKAAGVGKIADFVGRYYAMDRDNRWERIKAAYDLYIHHDGREAPSAKAALEKAYALGETDEFVQATSIDPAGVVRKGDAVLWLNFRPDRSRQITRVFTDPAFHSFPRPQVRDVLWVCMTRYDANFTWPGVRVAYPPQTVPDCLAEHLSKLGLSQFHTAETEKYAHVTYFLNGGRESPFAGEDRKLVPSPKVATYDLQPEMSAGPLTDEVLHAMGSGGYDFVVVNYANPDMVGHTGKLDATVKAVEFIDNCINRVTAVATELGFVTLITADHGNCEEMCRVNRDGSRGEPITKHTLNPVPLILVNGGKGVGLEGGGALENVAPTLLDLMGLPVPKAMTAKSLVRRA